MIKNIRDAEDPLFLELDKAHYNSLCHIIEANIKSVASEQRNTSGDLIDFIDEKIERDTFLVSSVCDKNGLTIQYKRTKRKCYICHSQLTKTIKHSNAQSSSTFIYRAVIDPYTKKLEKKPTEESQGRYEQIPSNYPNEIPQVKVGEPTFLNPNSYENCREILRKIGVEAGIERYGGKKRQWVIIECDGLPFRLCFNIIKDTYTCSICNTSYYKKDAFIRHSMSKHNELVGFDWVLLKPAGGHFEMNSIKALFELNWVPFLSKLCYFMGYKTDAAQFVAKNCKDHHQAWELLLVFFFGSLRELIVLYVRARLQKRKDGDLSIEDFLSFSSEMKSYPNYIYMCSQITNCIFAIINFRMALRRNNLKLAQSAVYKLSDMLYGRFHPFYQLIEIHFLAQMFTIHEDAKPLYETYFSVSLSRDASKGESWDFVLENISKHTQGLQE